MIQFDRSDVYDLRPGTVLISEPVSDFAENFFAAQDNMRLNDQSQSKERILKDLWTPIVEEMRETFPNQGFGGHDFEDPADFLVIGAGVSSGADHFQDRYNFAVNTLLNFMNENQESLPDHLKGITLESLEDIAKQRAQAAKKYAEEVGARNFTFSGTLGQFTGGVSGVLDEPTNAFGIMGFAAKNLWRLAFTEAAIGAGTGAIAEAGVADWYEELGYDYTYQDFLRNVAYNAAGGAVLGVGIRVSADAAKKGWNAISKSGKANKNSQALADAAEAREELEADNPFEDADLPPAQAEHISRTVSAEAAIENNTLPTMPNEATIQPSPEMIEAATDNLNGVMFSVNPRDVNVDAKRFQFKEGGDEYGVTERLRGVTEWDPIKAGTVIFWEDVDGKIFVADGHQRVGLARRIQAQKPDEKIEIIGYKLRETDGVSAEKARVIAAMTNIAQGTGTAIDAAKVLRIEPGRIAELPPQSVLVRQARDLVNLSNRAFGAIVNEVIPANYGAIVGRLIDDPDLQDAAISVLAKSDPANLFQAEAIVRQVREMDTVQETQVSLFGEEIITDSLFTERARVLDRTTKLLRGDKAAFESLSKNAERIEAEGNKLAKEQNQRRADQDAQAITLLQALANRKGVLSDDLSAAARTARETGNYAEAARNFADAVRRGIERGDFDGASTGDVGRAVDVAPQSRADAIEEEPTLEGFDEPTGPAAEAQTDQMAMDMFRTLDEPEQPRIESPIEEDRVELEQIRMPIDDDLPLDQVRAQVKALTDENVPLVKDLIARIDAKFGTKSGDNIKDLSKVTQKANRPSILAKKPWHKVSHIRDSYRFKTVIDDIRDVPAIFDELLASGISLVKVDTGKLFEPKEWGWRIIAFDLRMPNGQLVEWYLPIKELEAQKKAEGHLLFEEWRNKTPEEILEQNDAYMETIRKSWNGYDQAFQSSLDRMGISREDAAASWSKAESSMLEAARKSPSSSGMITSATVRGAEIQDPSIVRMAEEPSVQKIMARDVPSSISAKSVSDIGEPPTEDISDITIDIKPDDFDLEIPLASTLDEDGNAIAVTKTLRDIKADIDAEDALINRLGVCGL